VQCAERSVDIYEVQLQNKKRLTVKDFFNGYSLNVGDMLV
jgi:methionyl-tRNA formyltransferase